MAENDSAAISPERSTNFEYDSKNDLDSPVSSSIHSSPSNNSVKAIPDQQNHQSTTGKVRSKGTFRVRFHEETGDKLPVQDEAQPNNTKSSPVTEPDQNDIQVNEYQEKPLIEKKSVNQQIQIQQISQTAAPELAAPHHLSSNTVNAVNSSSQAEEIPLTNMSTSQSHLTAANIVYQSDVITNSALSPQQSTYIAQPTLIQQPLSYHTQPVIIQQQPTYSTHPIMTNSPVRNNLQTPAVIQRSGLVSAQPTAMQAQRLYLNHQTGMLQQQLSTRSVLLQPQTNSQPILIQQPTATPVLVQQPAITQSMPSQPQYQPLQIVTQTQNAPQVTANQAQSYYQGNIQQASAISQSIPTQQNQSPHPLSQAQNASQETPNHMHLQACGTLPNAMPANANDPLSTNQQQPNSIAQPSQVQQGNNCALSTADDRSGNRTQPLNLAANESYHSQSTPEQQSINEPGPAVSYSQPGSNHPSYNSTSQTNNGLPSTTPPCNAISVNPQTQLCNEWMPSPENVTNCIPGLEYLVHLEEILIRQQSEVTRVISAANVACAYNIINNEGQQIYVAAIEKQKGRPKNGNRPISINIKDNSFKDIVSITRPAIPRCMCHKNPIAQQLVIQALPSTSLAYIRLTGSGPRYDIFDATENKLLTILGPLGRFTRISGPKVYNFQIICQDNESQQVIANIVKHWSGSNRLAIEDVIQVNVPANLDINMKMAIIAASLQIDQVHFLR